MAKISKKKALQQLQEFDKANGFDSSKLNQNNAADNQKNDYSAALQTLKEFDKNAGFNPNKLYTGGQNTRNNAYAQAVQDNFGSKIQTKKERSLSEYNRLNDTQKAILDKHENRNVFEKAIDAIGNSEFSKQLQRNAYNAVGDIKGAKSVDKPDATYSALKETGMSDDDIKHYLKNYGTMKEYSDIDKYYKKRSVALSKIDADTYKQLNEYNQAEQVGTSFSLAGTPSQAQTNALHERYQKRDEILKKTGWSVDEFEKNAQYVREVENENMNAKNVADSRKMAKDSVGSSVAASALTVPLKMTGPALAEVEKAKSLFYADKDAPVDTNSLYYQPQNMANEVRNTTAEELGQATNNKAANAILKYGYQGAMAAADSAALVAGVSAGLGSLGMEGKALQHVTAGLVDSNFFMSAYTDSLKQSYDEGLGGKKANQYAVIQGLNEVITEIFSLDMLSGMFARGGKAALVNGMKSALEIGGLAGVEGSEEVFADILNTIADNYINNDFSDYNQAIYEYKESGMTEEQAKSKARMDKLTEMRDDFITGAISGGLGAGSAHVMTRKAYTGIGEKINQDKSQVTKIVEAVKGAKALEGSTAQQIFDNKDVENISDADLGRAIQSMQEAAGNEVREVFASELESKGLSKDNASEVASKLADLVEGAKKNINVTNENKEAVSEVLQDFADHKLDKQLVVNTAIREVGNILSAEEYKKQATKLRNSEKYAAESMAMKYAKQAPVTVAGNNARIKSIVSTGSNPMVKLDNGKTVALDQVEFESPKMQELYSAASAMDNVNVANSMLEYASGIPVETMREAGKQFFDAGKLNLGYEDVLNNPKNAKFTALFKGEAEEAFLKQVYMQGQNASEELKPTPKADTSNLKKNAKFKNKSSEKYSKEQEQFFSAVAKLVKNDITVEDFLRDNAGHINKKILGSHTKGQISLANKKNNNIVVTTFHEAMENLEVANPQAYRDLKKEVMATLQSNMGMELLNENIKSYQKDYQKVEGNKSLEDASNELFNDIIGQMFTTKQGVEAIVNETVNDSELSAPRKQGVLENVKDITSKMIKAIKGLMKNKGQASWVHRYISEKEAADIVNKAMAAFKNTGVKESKSSESEKAETKHSVEVDSEGRTLTEDQQAYFADSKVRDEQGRLKVMYHGTERAEFTVFDAEHADDGVGLFFTDKEKVAKGYSGTEKKFKYKYTLDDLNRMVDSDEKIVRSDDVYQLQNYDAARDKTSVEFEGTFDEMKNYVLDMYGTVESGNYEVYLNATNPLVVDAKGENWDNLSHGDETWTTRQYASYAKENGYDSLIVNDVIDTALYASNMEKYEASQVVVIFDSNQVKSVDNEHPTDNEDIRYSVDVDTKYLNKDAYTFLDDGKLALTYPKDLGTEDWTLIAKLANRLGYDIGTAKDAKEVYTNLAENSKKYGREIGMIFNDDLANELKKVFGVEVDEAQPKYTEEEAKKYADAAEAEFGITEDYDLASYLDVNGNLIDFSEGQNYRAMDHREITPILDLPEDANYSDGLIAFVNMGNIRINNGYGFELAMKPNKAQKVELRGYIDSLDGNVLVDFMLPDGNTLGSAYYAEGTASTRVINDIDSFYDGGDIPTGNAKYSIDVEYEKALADNDLVKLESLVKRAARAAGYDSPKLYHGTSRFGFTKFDLEKMDDKATIFLTSNPNIASTYSGTMQQKKISEGFTKDPMTVPVEELADELNANIPDDGVDRHYEYYDKKKLDALNEQNEQALNEIMSLIQQIEAMPNYQDMKVSKTVEQVKTNLYLYTAKELLQNRERNKDFGAQLWTIAQSNAAKDIDDSVRERIGQIEEDIRKAFVLNNEMQDEAILEDSLDGYVFEVYSPMEARVFLRKQAGQGIYSLYGKLGKSMIVDGAGRNWNALEKQWVKGYTSQFNAENTELIREDGRIMLYSQEGDLLRDMQENDFTDAYTDEELKQHLLDGLDYIYGIKRGDIQTTRDIVKFAKQHGYDSVLFKNIRDNGGRNHKVDFDEIADVYAFFRPEDVKSADAITYDNKGNVIPLSERFIENNDDIRFSVEINNNLTSEENEYIIDELFARNNSKANTTFETKDGKIGVRNNRSIFIVDEMNDTDDVYRPVRIYDVDFNEGDSTYTSLVLKEIEKNEEEGRAVTKYLSQAYLAYCGNVREGNYIRFYDFDNFRRNTEVKYGKNGNVLSTTIRTTRNRKNGSRNFAQRDSYTRFSIAVDSEGHKLSQEQQNYFKDSKIRDEEGRLLVVYHGSTDKFYEFDENKIGQSYGGWLQFGRGYYFSGTKKEAKEFAKLAAKNKNKNIFSRNVRAFYLDIKNPFIVGESSENFDSSEEYRTKDGRGAFVLDREKLITYGYDGVVYKKVLQYEADQYIAFYPSQIKLVSNKKPTENNDIRFSVAVDSEGHELSQGQQDYFKDSQARDKDGNLKVYYHGTNRKLGFTVFNPETSDDKISLFFTDNLDVAFSYGATKKEYNPYEANDVLKALSKIRESKSIEELNEALKLFLEHGHSYRVEKTGWYYEFFANDDVDEKISSLNFDYLKEQIEYYVGNENGASGVYNVYLNATNPLIVNANEKLWNQLEPIVPITKHYYDVEVEENADGTFITYHENGEEKTDSSNNYDDLYAFYREYGITDDDQDELFESDYLYLDDIFLDANGKRTSEFGKTRDYAKYAKENGYDSVIFNDLIDYGVYGVEDTPSQVVVVFDSNQVKSIHNENPTENDDIRYSLSVDQDDIWMDIMEQADSEYVAKTSAIIEEGNRLLQDGTVKVTKMDAKRVAADIIDKYQSNANQEELAENIRKVFAYAKENPLSPKDFASIMQAVAMPVVSELKFVDDSMEQEYKNFKKFFKGMKIKLDAPQKAEVANYFDSYNEYRKVMQKYGIVLNLNVGTSLDDVWSEIVEASGNRLSEAENSANQPIALLDYLKDIEDRTIVKSFERSAKDAPVYEGATKEEAAYGVAMDIIGNYYKYVAGEKLETDEATKYIKLNNDLQALARKEKARGEREFKKAVAEAAQEELGKKLARVKHIEAEIAEAKAKRGEAISSMDELTRLAYEELIRTDSEKVAAIRKQKNDEIARIKAKQRRTKENDRARRKTSELKKKVERNYNTLSSMVANPTETKHIPFGVGTENMVNAVIDVLELINLNKGNGSRTFADKMAKLQEKYDALKDNAGFDYDANTASMIATLKNAVLEEFSDSPKMVRELRDDELQTILDITNQLITQIRNENKLINNKKTQDAYEASTGIIEETKKSRVRRNPMTELAEKILGTKTVSKVQDAANKYFTWHLNAERWFNKVSGYKKDGFWKSIYQSLDDGQLKMLAIERDINKIFESVLEGKENQKDVARLHSIKAEDMVDIGLKDDAGKPVMVTRAMRLALIMHSYNDDNLRHVLGDGLTIPDMELYEKGRITDAYNKGKTYRYIPYDDYLMVYKTKGDQRNAAMRQLESEITSAKEFIKGLEKSDDFTDYEKRFLTSAKKMFHEYTGGVINDTSQVLKGYKIARVKNYFPIKSDPNFTKQDYAGLVRDGSIEGMGFLKNRVASKNPILLEDITNVILRQTNNTALYGGMAIPIRNLNMVLNITSHDANGYNQSVKSALAQTWGETDNKFLKNLITDLQMGRHQDPTIFDSMRSKFAGATLTLNLGVAIKQAASYPTAAAVVGWKPLGRAFADFGKGFIKAEGIEELEKRNPLLWKRSQGYSTQELGDIKDNRGWGEKITSKIPGANMIQFVDTGTVRTLEYAAMYYVDEQFKDLEKGSDEYWDKVSEVFTNIVQRTQPNYTTLQRPDMLRTPNQLIKQLAMFKTQPLQNFGIMYDAMAEYGARVSDERIEKSEASTMARKEAGKNLAKAVSSQVVAAAVFSLMTIAADMVYHKQYKYMPDNDEDKTMLDKMLESFFKGLGSTFSGMLFLGDTLYSALSYWLTGDTYYGLEVSVTGMINDVVDGVANLQSSINKLNEANTDEEAEKAQKKVLQQAKKIFTTAGEFAGIPANNIIKTFDSIVLYGKDIATGSAPGTSEEWIYSETESMKDRYLDAYNDNDQKEMNRIKEQIAEDKDKTEEEATKYVNNWVTSEEWDKVETEVDKVLAGKASSNKAVVASVSEIYSTKKSVSDEKSAKSSVSSSITSKYKNKYLELLKTDKTKAAKLQNVIISMYMAIGYSKADAMKKIKNWTK